MNRTFKDYALPNHHRRGIGGGNTLLSDSDDHHHLDLFSRNRRHASSDDRTAPLRLGRISVGSVKSSKIGSGDLLISTDSGKHDYDWLLTPPETPLFPSAEGNEFQQSFTAPRRSSAARSVSTTKTSRLSSTSRVESSVPSRPARSSSVTRSSVSYSQNNSSYYSSIRSSSSVLNTSSASVSSYIRPSSPITRSSSSTRPSTPVRTTPSRSSTPSKSRSAPALSSSIDKPRPSHGSRPSTPSSRPQISSRPSTPTRRSTISSSSAGPSNNISASTARALSNNGRSQTSNSRPSSPIPSRVRSQHTVIPSDFPHDTPPNLRTTLSDRPVSAGRSRPAANATITAKANTESQGGYGNFPRRASSPIVTRGRSVEPKGRSHIVHSNGYASEAQEPRRSSSYVSESPSRRNQRASTTTATDSNAYGRIVSKKPLDMAMKHVVCNDIRDGPGSMRSLTGTVLYPQSMRSSMSKIHASQTLKTAASGEVNGRLSARTNNGFVQHSENGKYHHNTALENGRRGEENGRLLFERFNGVDMFESSRYDAILMEEDLKNTNWLLSADEMSDQGLFFDPGFEPLPEPFSL